MKKFNKKSNKKQVVKELAEHFQNELDRKLPITVLPGGAAVYKNYLIKQNSAGNWGMYNYRNQTLIEQYFLKTCALMAAKAYSTTSLDKFFEIKRLDNRYWSNYCDNQVYRNNIKTAKEFDRYVILLNKLEDSEQKTQYYKEAISRMFKWSFV
jgi:sRNA-binding regulator protein Hfq